MILDSLENSARYESLNPYFKMAFDYVKNTDWSKVEPGKIMLDGKNCFINYMEQTGKTSEAAKFETHNNYLDIQIPLDGTEIMGFIPTCELQQPDAPYNPEKDITKYSDKTTCFVTLKPKHFAVFWPWDGHQPCIGEGTWHKLVVKIKL